MKGDFSSMEQVRKTEHPDRRRTQKRRHEVELPAHNLKCFGCPSHLISQLFLFSLVIVLFWFFSTKAIFTVFVWILTHFQRQRKLGALRLRFCGRRSWHQRQREPFLLFSSSAPSVYSIYLQLFTPGVAPQLCHCPFLLGFRWTVWPQLN